MAKFKLAVWEWLPKQERRYILEPFERICQWPTGPRNTQICAVPILRGAPFAVLFFRPMPRSIRERLTSYFTGRNFADMYEDEKLGQYNLRWCYPDWPFDEVERFSLQNAVSEPVPLFQLRKGTVIIWRQTGVWLRGPYLQERFRLPPGPLHLTPQFFIYWLQWQLNNPGSEAYLSHRWSYLGVERHTAERIEFIENQIPVLREMKQLMNRIICSETELNQHHTWFPNLKTENSYVYAHEPAGVLESAALTTRLQLWGKILKREFWHHLPDEKAIPLCAHDFAQSDPNTIQGEDATLHERLEAALYLREWVKDKATPEELAILFPNP